MIYIMMIWMGEIIEMQGKLEVDIVIGMMKYVDVYGYYCVIKISEIVQMIEGVLKLDW